MDRAFHFIFILFAICLCRSDELMAQEIAGQELVLHAGLGYDLPEGDSEAVLYYKATIGKVGSRYIQNRAYFHYGLTLGFVQRKVNTDTSVVERKVYLTSPRFDMHFDQIFSKGELYFGIQTKMGVVQTRSSDSSESPSTGQFFFDLNESLFFGGSYPVFENGSIYAEYGGLGRLGLGFRYLIRP